MSITPPSAYDTTNTEITPGGLVVGHKITATKLQVLANNHNFTESQYRPIVAACLFPRGANRTAGAGYEEQFIWRCPTNTDARSLEATIAYANTHAVTAGNIRFQVDATTGTIAVPALTTLTTASVTVAAPAGSAYTIRIMSDLPEVKIYSVTVRYAAITGAVSDAKKTSGFQWFQPSAEFAATEPVTTEHVDRLVTCPKAIYRAHPWCAVTLTDAVSAPIYDYSTTSTSFVTVAQIPVMIPVTSAYTWAVLGYGPAGSKVRLTLGNVTKTVTLSQTAMPTPLDGTQAYTFDTAAVDLVAGHELLKIDIMSGTGTTARIYSVQLLGG